MNDFWEDFQEHGPDILNELGLLPSLHSRMVKAGMWDDEAAAQEGLPSGLDGCLDSLFGKDAVWDYKYFMGIIYPDHDLYHESIAAGLWESEEDRQREMNDFLNYYYSCVL